MRRPTLLRVLLLSLVTATAATGMASADSETLHHPNVERWRPLVEQYFGAAGYGEEVEYALMIMWAESQGVPGARNPTSDASGLFQHLPKYWSDRSARAGWAGADIFDPEANIAVAAWLRSTNHSRGWYHWAPVWDRYPIGSWGPDTYWSAGRYLATGGGGLGTGVVPKETIRLSKVPSSDIVTQGRQVVWTYTVENTGEADLWAVWVFDETIGSVECPDRDLPKGAAITCTATETAGSGPGGGTAIAKAWADDGAEATASATATYDVETVSGLEMTTLYRGAEIELRLENVGMTDLWSLSVWVEGSGAIPCPDRALEVGGTTTCIVPAGPTAPIVAMWTDDGQRVDARAFDPATALLHM